MMRIATHREDGHGEAIVLESFGSRYSTFRELMEHHVPPAGLFNMIHGLAVASNGDVYVAEVRARRAQRLVRRRPFVDQQAMP